MSFDSRIEPVGVVGEANELVRPFEIATDVGSQAVDIVRRVAVAPLHAQDIDPRAGSVRIHGGDPPPA